MQSPQPLTNICGFSTRKHVIFCTFYQKYTFIYCKKIPSTCNRNLDIGYLVNSFALFYDYTYSSNDKQRQVQRTIVSRTQLRLHFMQKTLILLTTLWSKGSRDVGPWHGAPPPVAEPLPAYTKTRE